MAINTETLAKGLQETFGTIVEGKVNAVKARELVEAVLEEIGDKIAQGEKVALTGFGDFEAKESKARTGRNPQTGEEIQIPASMRPSFSAKKALKDKVKGK